MFLLQLCMKYFHISCCWFKIWANNNTVFPVAIVKFHPANYCYTHKNTQLLKYIKKF